MIFLLILTTLLSACGYLESHEAKDSESSRVERLRKKRAAELEKASHWKAGWPSHTDCDGALFAGLSSAGGVETDRSLFVRSGVGVSRRPSSSKPCWVKGRDKDKQDSRSQCSRDMLTGFLWALWEAEDLGRLHRTADFLEANDWYCGKPRSLAVTKVTPNLQGLIGRMLYVLSGGKDDRDYRHLPTYYGQVERPFERHIQTLGILLQGEVDEALAARSFRLRLLHGHVGFRHWNPHDPGLGAVDVNGQMRSRLKENAEAHPKDPLFQAARGVYSGSMKKAMDLLLGGYPRPKYVRGDKPRRFERAHWLFTAKIVLGRLN